MRVVLLCAVLVEGIASGWAKSVGHVHRLKPETQTGWARSVGHVHRLKPETQTELANWLAALEVTVTDIAALLQPHTETDAELERFLTKIQEHFATQPAMTTETGKGPKPTKEFLAWITKLAVYVVKLDYLLYPYMETDAAVDELHTALHTHVENFPHLPKQFMKLIEVKIWVTMLMHSLDLLRPTVEAITETDPEIKALLDHINNLLEKKPKLPHHAPPKPNNLIQLENGHEKPDIMKWLDELKVLVEAFLAQLTVVYPNNVDVVALVQDITNHMGHKPALPANFKPPKQLMDWIHKLIDVTHKLEDKMEIHIGDDAGLSELIEAALSNLDDPEIASILTDLKIHIDNMPPVPQPLLNIGKWLYALAEKFLKLEKIVKTLPADKNVQDLLDDIKDHMEYLSFPKPIVHVHAGHGPADPEFRAKMEEFKKWLEDLWLTLDDLIVKLGNYEIDQATMDLIDRLDFHLNHGHHNVHHGHHSDESRETLTKSADYFDKLQDLYNLLK